MICAGLSQDFFNSRHSDWVPGIQLIKKISFGVLEAIFFSYPVSLVEFNVSQVEISLTQVLHLDAQEDEWDYGLGPLVLRDVAQPLHQLEILQLPDTTRRFETVRLCRILAHCPALKPFRVPFLRDSKDVRAIANLFGKACSGITTLTMYDPSPRSGYDATLTFIETFPAQQLQELKYYYYQDRYPERTSAGWFRHSESLRSIELFLTSAIRGNTLHRILTSFPALERLIVNDLQFPVQTRTSRRRRRTMGLHANPNSGAYSPDGEPNRDP